MRLRDIAHLRCGDKGDIANIAVIPYDEANYEFLGEHLTAAVVKSYFAEMCYGNVERYEVPGIKAFNFVLYHTLGGGVTKSLAIDRHGKALGMALADIELADVDTL